MFAAPVTVAHEGGHYIPTNREFRQLYCRFLHNIMHASKTDGKPMVDESIFAPKANSPEHFLDPILRADGERMPPSESSSSESVIVHGVVIVTRDELR